MSIWKFTTAVMVAGAAAVFVDAKWYGMAAYFAILAIIVCADAVCEELKAKP